MEKITLTLVAKYLGVSTAFLCEIRKGKKSFSKRKAKEISTLTGIPIEKILLSDGDNLFGALEKIYGKINTKRGRLPGKKEAKP